MEWEIEGDIKKEEYCSLMTYDVSDKIVSNTVSSASDKFDVQLVHYLRSKISVSWEPDGSKNIFSSIS